jgi:hypothetical protein
MRTELACERDTPYLQAFLSVKNIQVIDIALFQIIRETRVSLGKIPSPLEAGVSCTLFLMRTE